MRSKPLYLHAADPVQVTLVDPALCVSSGSSASHLFPLRSIERIQVSGPVEWQTAALLACIDRGINVQFVNRHGQCRGRLVGSGRVNHSLVEHLQRLFERPGWESGYRQWCWARGLQTQRYVAHKLGFRFRDARDLKGLPKWCESRLITRAQPSRLSEILQWLHLDLEGYITHSLQQLGLWNDGPLLLEEPVDLAHDITEILQWVLLPIRHQKLKAHDAAQPVSRRLVATWFTDNSGYIKYQANRIVNLLEIWIMEIH